MVVASSGLFEALNMVVLDEHDYDFQTPDTIMSFAREHNAIITGEGADDLYIVFFPLNRSEESFSEDELASALEESSNVS